MSLVLVELRKLLALPAARLGLALGLFTAPAVAAVSASGGGQSTAADVAFIELWFAVVGAILLGVVTVSSEYRHDGEESAAGRQIATSLTAVPDRRRLLAAKAGALSLTVAVLALLAAAVTLPLAGGPYGSGLAGRVVGLVVYWVCSALIAFAVTLVLRNGVIPLAALILNSSVVSFSFLLSKVVSVANYLPDLAGQRMFLRGAPTGVAVAPLTGGLVMAAWTAALLAAGGYVFHRRDA